MTKFQETAKLLTQQFTSNVLQKLKITNPQKPTDVSYFDNETYDENVLVKKEYTIFSNYDICKRSFGKKEMVIEHTIRFYLRDDDEDSVESCESF